MATVDVYGKFYSIDQKLKACEKIVKMDEWVWNVGDDYLEVGNTWLMEGPPDGEVEEYVVATDKMSTELYRDIDDEGLDGRTWYEEWVDTFNRIKNWYSEQDEY